MVHFFAVPARRQRRAISLRNVLLRTNLRRQVSAFFFLLFLDLSAGSKNSTPGKFAFWHLKRVGINATKFISSSQFFVAALNKLHGGRMQREINEAREKGGRHVRKEVAFSL